MTLNRWGNLAGLTMPLLLLIGYVFVVPLTIGTSSEVFAQNPTPTPSVNVQPPPPLESSPIQVLLKNNFSLRIYRIREADTLNEKTPKAPGQTFLIIDAMVRNLGREKKCLYDGDFRVAYTDSENTDQTTLPSLDNAVENLRRQEASYIDVDFPKPNQFQYNVRGLDFCLPPEAIRRTVLIYDAPESWAQMVLNFGEKESTSVSLCLVRTNRVENGFREVFFTTQCSFQTTFEQTEEAYTPNGFSYFEEVPVPNCDSVNPTMISRGAEIPQAPAAQVEVKSNWQDLLGALLPSELALQIPFAQVALSRNVELNHKLEEGKPWITVTSNIAKTIPGRTEAKYKFVWREVSVKGVMVVTMVSTSNRQPIAISRIPYEITGQIRLSIETVYEQACGTATP